MINLDTYKDSLESLKKKLNIRKGLQQSIISDIDDINKELFTLNQSIDVSNQLIFLFQKTSDSARQAAKQKLESIVTQALQFVFEQDISFEIDISEVSGKPTAEFYLVYQDADVTYRTKPIDSNGGGIIDMISIALRIAILEIYSEPRVNGPIILDEPGKHVSEEYVEKMAAFLKYLSTYFNRQIIMVTHQQELAHVSDNSFQVRITGGISNVMES